MSIRTERRDDVLVVTIDRPEARNALDRAASRALAETWMQFREDAALRVAVLTGAGDKSFCSGADLKEIGAYYRSMSPIERRERGEREAGLGGITRNLDPDKPVIAAVNGHCLAGGLELALACDLRVAAEHSTFGLPEVRWGLMPGAGGTQRLPRAIPLAVAAEMILTAQPIDAQRAYQVGLVNRVVPAARLMDEALALARWIARNGPLAVQAARAALYRGLHLPLEEGLRLEQFYAEPLRASDDVQEGLRAFAEKREPRFQGR
jgi:enoyl-CoA hydratase/carnithine racemase